MDYDLLIKNTLKESETYTEDFWYNKIEKHGEVYGYGEEYYTNKLYNLVISKINDIPSNGYIVLMGTHNCVSFNKLIDIFGEERCIGIDLGNPTNNSRIKIKNILDFDESDDIPVAFSHNDLGSYTIAPLAKIKAQTWLAKNTVQNGYILSRNNLNTIKFPVEEYMSDMGFINTSLKLLEGFIDLCTLDENIIQSHMLSKKSKPEIWGK
jgi:hypothetical protein